jgi:hypothetical protein
LYKSHLHEILIKTLEGTRWTRSTKDEDNFRQVVCSSLYTHISPNNVEIPSTRSGHGDIKIFNRRIELKYASNEKPEQLEAVIEDFELLLESKIEFSIVAIKLDSSAVDNYLHRCIHMPMLAAMGAQPGFGNRAIAGHTYKQISIFLAATYPHAPKAMKLKEGRGKNSTAYLSFESTCAITRFSFLDTPKGLLHVDVIGSKEDGLMCFLFKRADGVQLVDVEANTKNDICIPYAPNPIKIAESRIVNVEAKSQKGGLTQATRCVTVESSVPCFNLKV